ncbi:MAG: hypothetical protein ABW110_14380 [Steroidobacteraceae bacterium]
MARHVFLAFVNPVRGREAEFNQWMDNFHLPEGLQNQGFVRVTRYKLSDAQFLPGAGRAQYLIMWEIESDDLGSTLKAALEQQMKATFSDALDAQSTVTHVYTDISGPVSKR